MPFLRGANQKFVKKHLTFSRVAMEFREPFVAIMVILQESFKLLPKNGKLVAFITIIPSLLYSLFFLIFYFSCKSLLSNKIATEPYDPPFDAINSSYSPDFTSILGLNEDLVLMLLPNYVLFILAFSIITLYSTIATILVSANSHLGTTLSYKDLTSGIARAWRRQYVTRFYNTLLFFGFIFFVLFAASPVLMLSGNSMADVLPSAIFLGIAAWIWYMYLSVIWVLGFVISVIEEDCYGIEALGKAGKIIRGNRIPGFILNTVLSLLVGVMCRGLLFVRDVKWIVILGLVFLNIAALLRFFYFVAYTVLYFHCRKNHGEKIEVQGGFEYSKVSTRMPV